MPSEILHNLYLGNKDDSKNPDFMKSIDVTINLTKDIQFFNKFGNIRIPINDPGPNNDEYQQDNLILFNISKNICRLIKNHLDLNHKVFVHCRAGIQRSASLILIYLIEYHTKGPILLRLKIALNYLIKKRAIVFYQGTECNFKYAIINYLHNL